MYKTKTKHGFTIIEVVLVLAIAGLIFMMVFLALPALQRSQRDTQRRDDMSRVISQLQQYMANNRGALPTTAAQLNGSGEGASHTAGFIDNYLRSNGDEFLDPDGNAYTFAVGTNGSEGLSFDHVIHYYVGMKCEGENASGNLGNRRAAIRYKLENAGTYCGNI